MRKKKRRAAGGEGNPRSSLGSCLGGMQAGGGRDARGGGGVAGRAVWHAPAGGTLSWSAARRDGNAGPHCPVRDNDYCSVSTHQLKYVLDPPLHWARLPVVEIETPSVLSGPFEDIPELRMLLEATA